MGKLWKNRPALIALTAAVLFLLLAAFTVNERTAGQAEGLFHEALDPVQGFVQGLRRM